MAVFSSALTHSDAATITNSLAATTSTAEIAIGSNAIVAIVATGNMHIKVGVTGMSAASTSDFFLPSGVIYTMALGRNCTHIRLYNPTGGSINYYIQRLETGR